VDLSETKSHAVLRDEILADAQRQAQRLIRKAEREAKSVLDKAAADIQEERSSKLEAAQAKADRKRTLITATVPVEIGRMRAARVEQELLALRDQVRAKLRQREGYEYVETLASLAVEALASMEGETFVLELSEADRQAVGDALAASVEQRVQRPNITVTVSPKPAPIDSGVIVRDQQGRQVWDNSLDARLDRMWPMLRSQIAEHVGIQSNVTPSGGQS
jgi:V/A-type H+-transporting ATPase subunit E